MLKFTPPSLTVAPNGALAPEPTIWLGGEMVGMGRTRVVTCRRACWSDVVPFGRAAPRSARRVFRPPPPRDFGHVLAMRLDVLAVLDQPVPDCLLEVRRPRTELRDTVDHVLHEMEPIEV